jgi:hypothetical protein
MPGPFPTRRSLLLTEDHIAVRTAESPPLGDATLQCPAHPCRHLGMSWAQLREDRHRADAGCGVQHRHDLALPQGSERVGTSAPAVLSPLRRQPRIGLDPVGGGSAEPGLGGGDGGPFGLTVKPLTRSSPMRYVLMGVPDWGRRCNSIN